jgi:2-keto-3-deoxy-L-rhamnonate aldolase RhmA/quercetin dioxygenase-like cupin family protein
MKASAIRLLKRKLAAKETALGMWITLESPSITEMAVGLGLDWIVIDAEHGHLDWTEITEHIRATVRSDTVALVRLAELNVGLVKRALDIGADGVIIPWIETVDQLRQAVTFAHYPPRGVRGIGGERATAWGQCFAEHVAEANDNVLIVPMIESVRGGQNIREMVAVEGVEVFFIGPADYSSSAGFAGQWEGPGIAEQLLKIKDHIVAAGKHCGVIATSDANLLQRQSQGFQLIGMGSDAGLLLRSMHTTLAAAGRDRKLNTGLSPSRQPERPVPLDRPPENFRPDRTEVINELGTGPKREIQPGVVFECLVGGHNGAKSLTTGVVTVSPTVQLAYHTHPTTESITLMEGQGVVEVEGRRYNLSPLDNVVVPPGVAHSVINSSREKNARFSIAFPTTTPARELVDTSFTCTQMPVDSNGPGKPGLERVNRFATAERFEEGHGATFIDFFNGDLMPNVEMSGGYGLFGPGDRLPAHIHDFDESICIIEGTATCVVEGRQYKMNGCSTALQPRGRVHYFVNQSSEPMAMLWVYAGPQPERIVVDERNATVEGCPWR